MWTQEDIDKQPQPDSITAEDDRNGRHEHSLNMLLLIGSNTVGEWPPWSPVVTFLRAHACFMTVWKLK